MKFVLVVVVAARFDDDCSKGISGSALPYSRRAPSWLKTSNEEVNDLVIKFAKKGLTPSQIGIVLRDSHGIGQVKNLTSSKIIRILRANGKITRFPLVSGNLRCWLCDAI